MKNVILILLLGCFGFAKAQDTTISKADIKSAAKLFDIQFTQKEIDTLYSDVIDNIANYKAMHSLSLPNSVGLSTWQLVTPVPANRKNTVVDLPLTKIELPKNKNDLAFYDISELAYLIKNKRLSFFQQMQLFTSQKVIKLVLSSVKQTV